MGKQLYTFDVHTREVNLYVIQGDVWAKARDEFIKRRKY